MEESVPPPHRVALTVEHCWHRVPGGTGRATARLVRALAEHPEVDPVGVSAWHRSAPTPEFDPGLPRRRVPMPRLAVYASWHRLRLPRIEWISGAVSLVHATGGAIPPTRRPLVVTVHDLAWIRYPSMFTSRGLRLFERAHDLTVRHADLVLCPSIATLDDCAANGVAAERLRLVPWGVDTPALPGVAEGDAVRSGVAEGDAVRARYGLDRPFVLAVGTLEPRKNLGALIRAMNEVASPADLVIVGPSGWNDELSRLQDESGDRVRFTGFVDDATLSALYAAAAVFCYPSRFEGFGLPVLEAMAHGAAVVTSTGTATAEVVGGTGVTIDPDDVAGLAAALDELLADPARRATLGAAARTRAATYTWSATAAATVAAYRELW